jgi:membrane-associated phospholipid phosphatase
MDRRPTIRLLAWVAAIGLAVFAALTAVVVAHPTLAIDSHVFKLVDRLRAPWLDHVMRAITTLGLLAVVGTAVVLGAALLYRRRHRLRAAALVLGLATAWVTVWVTKAAVDRPRPPDPLVHTAGASFPSGHSANSVGWLAIGLAIGVAIPSARGRKAVVAVGALITTLVGISRIYLRAHYASDVIAGWALSIAMYALAALAVPVLARRRAPAPR